MASLNKVMLIGNLTRDPEVRFTPKGTPVAELGLAINRVYTTETQERREEVTFVDVTLWGRTAELAGQYLAKGRSVYIEGRLQLEQWEDKTTNQTRSKLKVVGDQMQFLGQREGGAPGGGGGGGGYQQRNQPSGGYQGGGGGGYQGGGGGGGYQGGGGGGGGYDSEPEGYGPPSGGGGGGNNYRPQQQPQQQPAAAPKQQQAPNFAAEEDDDIPF